MEPIWGKQHRPLLAKLVADFDHGKCIVDPAAYAAALNWTIAELEVALDLLSAARFFAAQREKGSWLITGICQLTRQLLAQTTDTSQTEQTTLAWSVVQQVQRDYRPQRPTTP